MLYCTVPSKVQNLRKMRKFGQNFSIFLQQFKLANWNGNLTDCESKSSIFWSKTKVLYSINSTLRQKLDQTFINFLNPWANFLLKFYLGKFTLAKLLRRNCAVL